MSVVQFPAPGAVPEAMLPGLLPPVGGPIDAPAGRDFRHNFEAMLRDQRAALAFAQKHHLAVLTVGADRNGVYLVVSPVARLKAIFGDECAWVRRVTDAGTRTENWLGLIDERIRVFWREVTCVH